ncbi:REP element-mobilizing transposase RayT [Solirubrobacter pauli]|uniref:REP element-mobilizing transposase RayT n=1 Tax=Solirubrobacter pauli TaxID=166793 RepID=A0A660LCG9_9ACTN|nr:transposase [Solirubrobacter pauli]RKQ92758.1 REP element-mobilizing transposase RayT [Solirubrobacter pauli]
MTSQRPRVEEAGAIYHVCARGAVGQDIFRDGTDRQRYLQFLARTVRWATWHCLSYCLMGNHIHLLLETPKPNLADGMMRFHGRYATWFNRRHGLRGHVFQGRYVPVRITSDRQLWTTLAYIVDNPVDAGFCSTPDGWPWSSHAAILNDTAPPWLAESRLFAFLGELGGDPRTRYAELVKRPGRLSWGA